MKTSKKKGEEPEPVKNVYVLQTMVMRRFLPVVLPDNEIMMIRKTDIRRFVGNGTNGSLIWLYDGTRVQTRTFVDVLVNRMEVEE